jgi:antitoxin component of MazEF toxin-antitoxin module
MLKLHYNKIVFLIFKMVKIQKLPSGQLIVTIPKVLAEYENLEKGTEVEFMKHEQGFLLKVKRLVGK